MRVLGIEIAGSNTQLIILDGTNTVCKIEFLNPSKLPLPPDSEEVNRLSALKKQVYEVLKSKQVESAGIIRADPGSSPLRARIECVIQLAAADASVPCKLVAAQTAAAAHRGAGNPVHQVLEQVSPGYLRKAAFCAWCVLNDKQ
jgi:Holliday junction resolvasome RuvABC endonuclease subunit